MPVTVIYIAAGMLFVGTLPLPYGYYLLLRLVVTGTFAWAAYVAYFKQNKILPWGFAVLALLFNPIIKIHLQKEVWAVVDVAAGILLLAVKRKIEESK